jgi:hypothetical protein
MESGSSGMYFQTETTAASPSHLDVKATQGSPAPSKVSAFDEARAELKVAVAMFTAAIDGVAALGLNPLEELVAAGFDPGLGTLPDVEAETPPNQLPPV